LIEGEIFGEEGFLNYETRQFSVKSLGDSSAIFRISMVDIEKKVW
jgi:CRP-like cAMP-binding protein